MENPEIWYPVNAYTDKRLLLVGLILVLVSVSPFFVPGISRDICAYAFLALWGGVFAAALVASIRYMHSL